MKINFYKYQGTGNDFILIDNRQLQFPKNDTKLVAQMCDRKFGIGADGLILLEDHEEVDFRMVYYNSDGNLSSMCGNGGRCITHFASFLEIIKNSTVFEAVDGLHHANIENNIVSLKMNNVTAIKNEENFTFLDTGSPHHVQQVENLSVFDVYEHGKRIRNEQYAPKGVNINFVEPKGDHTFMVRTYERGVENETLSCGTGVTAVALAMHSTGRTDSNKVILHTPGGDLTVTFKEVNATYEDIYLIGPAEQVFNGTWSV